MSRQAHLNWCKQRANAYFDRGDIQEGLASFLSDVTKSEETEDIVNHPLFRMGAVAAMAAGDLQGAKSFVNGWN